MVASRRWHFAVLAVVSGAAIHAACAQTSRYNPETDSGILSNYPAASGDPVLNMILSEPVLTPYSGPDAALDTGVLPSDLLAGSEMIDDTMPVNTSFDQAIEQLATPVVALANQAQIGERRKYPSTSSGLELLHGDCNPETGSNSTNPPQWDFLTPTEPTTSLISDFATGSSLDNRKAPPGSTNTQWCAASPMATWAVEPATLPVWGPILVFSLGTFVFWAARGFRTP
jgi:hypothetical protein